MTLSGLYHSSTSASQSSSPIGGRRYRSLHPLHHLEPVEHDLRDALAVLDRHRLAPVVLQHHQPLVRIVRVDRRRRVRQHEPLPERDAAPYPQLRFVPQRQPRPEAQWYERRHAGLEREHAALVRVDHPAPARAIRPHAPPQYVRPHIVAGGPVRRAPRRGNVRKQRLERHARCIVCHAGPV